MKSHICVLFYQKDGHTLLIDLADNGKYILYNDRCQAKGRLIHHNQFRTAHQGACDRKHLLLPSGQGSGRLPVSLLQARKKLIYPFQIRVQIIASHVGAHPKVLVNRQIDKYTASLGNQRNALFNNIFRALSDQFLSVELNASCRWFFQSDHRAKR